MMKRVLQFLRDFAAWIAFVRAWHRRFHGTVHVPPHETISLSAEEASACRQFFATPAGRKLIHAMRQAEVTTATHAALGTPKNGESRDYLSGYAAGFRSAFAYELTLSSPAPAHGATDDANPEADASAENEAS